VGKHSFASEINLSNKPKQYNFTWAFIQSIQM